MDYDKSIKTLNSALSIYWLERHVQQARKPVQHLVTSLKWILICRKIQAIQSKDRIHRSKRPRLYLNSTLCCSILILPVPKLQISATVWFGNKSALCAFLRFGDILRFEVRRQTFSVYVGLVTDWLFVFYKFGEESDLYDEDVYLLHVPASQVSMDLKMYCSLWKLLGWNL